MLAGLEAGAQTWPWGSWPLPFSCRPHASHYAAGKPRNGVASQYVPRRRQQELHTPRLWECSPGLQDRRSAYLGYKTVAAPLTRSHRTLLLLPSQAHAPARNPSIHVANVTSHPATSLAASTLHARHAREQAAQCDTAARRPTCDATLHTHTRACGAGIISAISTQECQLAVRWCSNRAERSEQQR
jgi:hypothetical protein